MPLIGVVDPSHKEMARDTQGRLPNWLTLTDALDAARDNKWSPWPWELLNAMFASYQNRDYISTSTLVDHCVRGDIIKRKEDYVEDLASIYVPFRGTNLHGVLEMHAHEDTIAEARFYTEVAGQTISCSPDHLTRTTLTDWKFTENPPMYNYPWRNHTEQVQFNAFIVRNATVMEHEGRKGWTNRPFDPRKEKATELRVVYLGPKFVKSLTVESTKDYFDIAKGKEVRGKQPDVWSDAKVLDILEPRVMMFQHALDIYPEWPEGAEELWGGDASYQCPGTPLCKLPNCIAKRYPNRLVW